MQNKPAKQLEPGEGIIEHKGSFYSISKGVGDEYLVLKVGLTKQNTKVIEDERIVEGENVVQVKQLIRKYPFTYFKKIKRIEINKQ